MRVVVAVVGVVVMALVAFGQNRDGRKLPAGVVLVDVTAEEVVAMLESAEAADRARESGDFAAYRAAVSEAVFRQTHNIAADQGKAFDAAHFPKAARMNATHRGEMIAAVGLRDRAFILYDSGMKPLPGSSYPLVMAGFVRDQGRWRTGPQIHTSLATRPETEAEWRDVAKKQEGACNRPLEDLRRPAEVPANITFYTVAKVVLKLNGRVIDDTRNMGLAPRVPWSHVGLLSYGVRQGPNTIEVEYEPGAPEATFKTTVQISRFGGNAGAPLFSRMISPQEKGKLQEQFVVEGAASPQPCEICETAAAAKSNH